MLVSKLRQAPLARRSYQAAAAATAATVTPASTSSAYSHLNPPGTKVSNASYLVYEAAVNACTLDKVALPEKLSSREKFYMRKRTRAGNFPWSDHPKLKARKKAFHLNDTLKTNVYTERGDLPNSRSVFINRPLRNNGVNYNVVEELMHHLLAFEEHPRVRAAFLRGVGDHFCHGRDLEPFYKKYVAGEPHLDKFAHLLRSEYALYHLIAHLGIPLVVATHGRLGSSGLGMTLPAAARLAVHSTQMSVSEAAYGWFPDCGMTWFLPRLKYEVNGKQFTGAGMWLALTGAQLDAWSMKTLGLATHVLAYPENLEDIRSRFGEKHMLRGEDQRRYLHFCVSEYDDTSAEYNPIIEHLPLIEMCFGGSHKAPDSHYDIDSVVKRLELVRDGNFGEAFKISRKAHGKSIPAGDDWLDLVQPESLRTKIWFSSKESPNEVRLWAEKQLQAMERMSPISLLVTFHLLKQGAQAQQIEDALKLEFLTAMSMLDPKVSDFWEGVSARKENRAPKWKYPSLAKVKRSDANLMKMLSNTTYSYRAEKSQKTHDGDNLHLQITQRAPPHPYIFPPIGGGLTWMGGVYEGEQYEKYLNAAAEDNKYLDNPNPEFKRRWAAAKRNLQRRRDRIEQAAEGLESKTPEQLLAMQEKTHKEEAEERRKIVESGGDPDRVIAQKRQQARFRAQQQRRRQ